nr:PREDICTED: somatomedin-B and thrombospondin type-1 domain-containing protein-like isoform X2 [Rhinolophus sinicus]
MAPRGAGAARILSLVLVLAAVALVSWAREPRGALWPGQGCAALGRCCPGRDPTCAARGPPLCFCDQACGAVRDCCADYARACPAVSCVVAEWSGWSRCVKPCQLSYRVRQRHVLQEPRNGGALCPPLEERAGCVEYRNRQGVECQQSLLPALITTGSYGKERKKRGVPKEQETVGNQLLQWQAAGHPRCQGTWERLGQRRDCSCPEVHSLVFI